VVNSPQNQLLMRAQNGALLHPQNLAQHHQLTSTAALLNPSLAQAINMNLALGCAQPQHGAQRFMRPTLQQQQQNILNLQNSALLNLSNGQTGSQLLTGPVGAPQQLNSQNNALLAALAAQQQQQNQQQSNRLNSLTLPAGYS
jgi:hypothetical protein